MTTIEATFFAFHLSEMIGILVILWRMAEK